MRVTPAASRGFPPCTPVKGAGGACEGTGARGTRTNESPHAAGLGHETGGGTLACHRLGRAGTEVLVQGRPADPEL